MCHDYSRYVLASSNPTYFDLLTTLHSSTTDEARVREFGLKQMWRSPNGTIRNILNGQFLLLKWGHFALYFSKLQGLCYFCRYGFQGTYHLQKHPSHCIGFVYGCSFLWFCHLHALVTCISFLQDGPSQSVLEGMLLVISIELLISLLINQENWNWFSVYLSTVYSFPMLGTTASFRSHCSRSYMWS